MNDRDKEIAAANGQYRALQKRSRQKWAAAAMDGMHVHWTATEPSGAIAAAADVASKALDDLSMVNDVRDLKKGRGEPHGIPGPMGKIGLDFAKKEKEVVEMPSAEIDTDKDGHKLVIINSGYTKMTPLEAETLAKELCTLAKEVRAHNLGPTAKKLGDY